MSWTVRVTTRKDQLDAAVAEARAKLPVDPEVDGLWKVTTGAVAGLAGPYPHDASLAVVVSGYRIGSTLSVSVTVTGDVDPAPATPPRRRRST